MATLSPPLDARMLAKALAAGSVDDPFAYLGPHALPDGNTHVRVFRPDAKHVWLLPEAGGAPVPLTPQSEGLFDVTLERHPGHYRLRFASAEGGHTWEAEDPYRFGLAVSFETMSRFRAGRLYRAYEQFGCRPWTLDGVAGRLFVTWAPKALRVSVVGDFNGWDGRAHVMRRRHEAGVWEFFLPGDLTGQRYMFEVVDEAGNRLAWKADPYAEQAELRPARASVIASDAPFKWTDGAWMARREALQKPDKPMSIYEVHPASWRRPASGPKDVSFPTWDEMAETLLPYVKEMGFTHVELLPVMEHPYDGSWGYQPTGMFAPTARFGSPDGLKRFVDRAHRLGIGVILDWVPAHFPDDEHGLHQFDGSHLYDHPDPQRGYHPEWKTRIYDFGRAEVMNFLIASAISWLDRFHIDGLRVDAVASMLYLDYSRKYGEWSPNIYGGNINLEAVSLIQHLNDAVHSYAPGTIMIAEESTAWPNVTKPVLEGGLGFDYKWNLGWMHDTLRYFGRPTDQRAEGHDDITFSLVYAFDEQFCLPLSHDEVVHGKGSVLGRMKGEWHNRLAELRTLYALQWTHPGRKLMFMGSEFADPKEWADARELDWSLLENPDHAGVKALIADLNALYRATPALHRKDGDKSGFKWVQDLQSADHVYAYARLGDPGDAPVLVVINMDWQAKTNWVFGAPQAGRWKIALDTHSSRYGGSGQARKTASTGAKPANGFAQSLSLTLPPYSAQILVAAG